MLARDLQSIVVYDLEGKFAGIRRPNSKLPIEIDGMKIVIEDAIGSTGLELKVHSFGESSLMTHSKKKKKDDMFCLMLLVLFTQTDPGVPVVYAGFGALMLTTCISYLSHSQVIVTISINILFYTILFIYV